MSSIFLSHSHHDKEFTRKLGSGLRRAGHIVWIDEADIDVGDSLIEEISRRIDSVDYVVAIISKASVNSEWVKNELDIAMTRQIEEKRVLVLPILLDEVELPGFLKGKLCADFREEKNYSTSFKLLLRGLGRSAPLADVSEDEKEDLKQDLELAQAKVAQYTRELGRQRKLSAMRKSPKLIQAIDEANKRYPEYAHINSTYAFEAGGSVITLDYLLHMIRKARMRGSHPMEFFIEAENKWGYVELMLEAYRDYLGIQESET